MDIEKLYKKGFKEAYKFKELSGDIVKNYVSGTTDENKEKIRMFLAADMAMGAISKRNEYLITGIAIGVLGTILISTVGRKRKKKEDK